MRLLLDAHISGRVVGRALTEDGHDVRAIDSERELEGLSDRRLLELAISEGRVLVSANEKDFVPLIERPGWRPVPGFAGSGGKPDASPPLHI